MTARRRALTFAILSSISALVLIGCGSPNKANIEVRKQNADLREKLAAADRAREGDRATIESLQKEKGTLPTLPKERLDRLVTVHGIELGRATGQSDKGLKIYLIPLDEDGDALKAAGTITVDLFDLAAQKENRIGHWEFPADAVRKAWFNQLMLEGYIFDIPLQTRPNSNSLTVRATFKDELTQRTFTAQREIKFAATQPASR